MNVKKKPRIVQQDMGKNPFIVNQFINPMIFFSGNRLKKYPDNIQLRK